MLEIFMTPHYEEQTNSIKNSRKRPKDSFSRGPKVVDLFEDQILRYFEKILQNV